MPKKVFIAWGDVVHIWVEYDSWHECESVFFELEDSQFDNLEPPSSAYKNDKRHRLIFNFGLKSKLIFKALSELRGSIKESGDKEIVATTF